MDTQDQSKITTPAAHICHRCGWPFPNPHTSSKHMRAHKRICGTIEGYTKLIDSEAVSDDEHHSDEEDIEITPSPTIEKKIIEERSSKSEDDLFSDAVTEFSDSGFSTPGAEERFFDTTKLLFSPLQLIKGDDNLEIFHTPNTGDRNGSHKHMLVDDVAPSKTDTKDQREEAEYVLSVPSDIPLVDKAETLLQDFKDHKNTENSYVVDTFEVKIMEDKIEESQPCKNGESTMKTTVSECNYEETVKEVESVVESEEKIVEMESVCDDSKESCSSSRNSLEANWGSVSVLSTASIDAENSHSINKSWLGKSEAFEGPLVGPKEETVDQKACEVNAVKAMVEEESQPLTSEGVDNNGSEGRKRSLEAIEKVTNWSTSENLITTTTPPLKNLVISEEEKSSSPKQLKIQKDEVVDEKVSEPGKSNLVKLESSPPKFIGEGKKVRKKGHKGRVSWVPFACCSSINVS